MAETKVQSEVPQIAKPKVKFHNEDDIKVVHEDEDLNKFRRRKSLRIPTKIGPKTDQKVTKESPY